MKENYERLPDSELLVMQCIWKEKSTVGTGRVVELVNEQKKWSRSTIQVLLSRLTERGFLKTENRGRLKFYIPLILEEDYLEKETKTFIEQFYNNSYKKLIASIVQDSTVSEEDINDIMNIIKTAKRGETDDSSHL